PEAPTALLQARQALQEGHAVCIFAEGAISRTGDLLPFKRGFERIIEGLEVPVIPVHLDRLWGSIFSFQDGRFFWKWPKQLPYPAPVSSAAPWRARARARRFQQVVKKLGSAAMTYRSRKTPPLPWRNQA